MSGFTSTSVQPLDSDLTALAALTTTATGRSLLEIANGAAGRTILGAQASDADLDAVAASGLSAAWTAFTPTVTPGSGAFTTVAAAGRYLQVGKIVFVRIVVTITTNGTAGGYFIVTAPVATGAATGWQALSCVEYGVTGVGGKAILAHGSTDIYVGKYDATYLGGDNYLISITGCYEVA